MPITSPRSPLLALLALALAALPACKQQPVGGGEGEGGGAVTQPPGAGGVVGDVDPATCAPMDPQNVVSTFEGSIGPGTVAGAAKAGLAGIVVTAGETILMDASGTRQAADRAGLFVFGATARDLAAWGGGDG